MNLKHLSRQDTALLKGLAIAAIVMHNFCHWLPGCVVENEYMFHAKYSYRMLSVLTHGGPHAVLNLFSYFGHYGVPLFLFVSGLGLVKKYEDRQREEGVPLPRFAAYNVLKLWKLMIPAVLLLILCETYRCGMFRHRWQDVAYMLTFVTNFLPASRDALLPHRDLLLGPWWYFSLTLQMYFLWRLCYYRRSRKWILASAAVCLAVQVLSVTLWADERQTVLDYFRYNLLGCLLPFALGVWTGRYGLSLTPPRWMAALVLFVAGCFNVYLWMLTPVAAVLVVAPAARIVKGAAARLLVWLGGISAALFALHPIVRGFFLSPGRQVAVYSSLTLYLLVSVAGALLLTLVLGKIRVFKF